MVLLSKDAPLLDLFSGYRPLCFLGEAGKLFEMIIAARLVVFLDRGLPWLKEGQYGFRRGRSTIDTVALYGSRAEETSSMPLIPSLRTE